MGLLDRCLRRLFSASAEREGAEAFAYFHAISAEDGSLRYGPEVIQNSISTKSAPLLAHVSIMIAGLVVLASTLILSKYKIVIISIEIVIYLIIAIGCLICIHEDIINEKIQNYRKWKNDMDRDIFISIKIEDAIDALIKLKLFSIINKMTIYITIIMLTTTPFILLL